jgi:Kef-type K+ transport system membrane component KefB
MDWKKIFCNFLGMIGFLGLSTVVHASSGGGEESIWNSWLLTWKVINTIVLIALLVYFVKKPLVTFFSDRKDSELVINTCDF